jgi:hypothetical protein
VSTAEKTWLSKHEAAAHIGVSERTLRRLMEPDENGVRKLRSYKPVSGRTVLKLSDLNSYMESVCVGNDAEGI